MNLYIFAQKSIRMELNTLKISDLRVDYALKSFDEKDVNPNPFAQFTTWMHEAITAEVNEPNAMTLATSTQNGIPSARIVLLKEVNENGFVFFTNYESKKAKQLSVNSNAALVFCWLELQRQVRIEGIVSKISKEDSFEYFKTRPYASQIGAHVSNQSSIISSRNILETEYQKLQKIYPEGNVPLPENWGGFVLKPNLFEFWQGRQSRLHDRFEYEKNITDWKVNRLAP